MFCKWFFFLASLIIPQMNEVTASETANIHALRWGNWMKWRYFHFRQTFLQGEVFPSLTFCYSYKLSHLILSNASIAHMCLCVYESLDGFFFFYHVPCFSLFSPWSPFAVPASFGMPAVLQLCHTLFGVCLLTRSVWSPGEMLSRSNILCLPLLRLGAKKRVVLKKE